MQQFTVLSLKKVRGFLVSFVLDKTYFKVSIWISCIYKKASFLYKIHALFSPVLKLILEFGCVLLRNPLKMNAEATLISSFKSVKYISGPYHTFKAMKYSESLEYFISQI